MDNFVDERDYKLLESDKYTFFVLGRIMGGPCTLLLSDHERLIVCFSTDPFPVWIWTADDATEEEMERAYQVMVENNLMDGKHRYNIKYELADYFIKRALKDGIELSVLTNMFAYDCPKSVEPTAIAKGEVYKCEMKDKEELARFVEMFHEETRVDKMDWQGCLDYAEYKINEGKTFFWKDDEGNSVASCGYQVNGELASIGMVFTKPEHRRKHYAENLVYRVTKMAEKEGCTPMLYTDADYVASNACYEKIGYVLRGKLCTVG